MCSISLILSHVLEYPVKILYKKSSSIVCKKCIKDTDDSVLWGHYTYVFKDTHTMQDLKVKIHFITFRIHWVHMPAKQGTMYTRSSHPQFFSRYVSTLRAYWGIYIYIQYKQDKTYRASCLSFVILIGFRIDVNSPISVCLPKCLQVFRTAMLLVREQQLSLPLIYGKTIIPGLDWAQSQMWNYLSQTQREVL